MNVTAIDNSSVKSVYHRILRGLNGFTFAKNSGCKIAIYKILPKAMKHCKNSFVGNIM